LNPILAEESPKEWREREIRSAEESRSADSTPIQAKQNRDFEIVQTDPPSSSVQEIHN